MSSVFLAAPVPVPAPPPRPVIPKLILESWDGSRRIPLDDSTGWKALAGATGLVMPPVDVATAPLPGAHGSTLTGVRVEERPVFVPIKVTASDRRFVTHQAMVDSLLDLVDPLTGEFRLVGVTERGERELACVYTGGLEGAFGVDEFGLSWRKIGLKALACQPFARSRTPRTVEFGVDVDTEPFLGVAGGTDSPWPPALGSTNVIGENMEVIVGSEVPVHPALDLVGPMDSFAGDLTPLVPRPGDGVWSVSIPAGVPAGSTLRLVTDPRARSIRLGVGDPLTTANWSGSLAAGRVARGSSLSPFRRGLNILNVSAPGGSDTTRVRLSWFELYRSLW